MESGFLQVLSAQRLSSVHTNRQRAPLWSQHWLLLLLSSAQVNLCCQFTKTGDQKVTVMSLMTIGIIWEMLHVSRVQILSSMKVKLSSVVPFWLYRLSDSPVHCSHLVSDRKDCCSVELPETAGKKDTLRADQRQVALSEGFTLHPPFLQNFVFCANTCG